MQVQWKGSSVREPSGAVAGPGGGDRWCLEAGARGCAFVDAAGIGAASERGEQHAVELGKPAKTTTADKLLARFKDTRGAVHFEDLMGVPPRTEPEG